MQILLIGNFAPPYEEENLYNLSLVKKLEEDGHLCSVINISAHAAHDKKIVEAGNFIVFVINLLRLCRGKDVVHFLTKGYLRLGLLKLMTSIVVGKLFRVRSIVTFHSELFSILGQMRSPFGGTQTLFTSFFLADKIIFADRDTYDVAEMYRKKSNFELVPSFVYLPDDINKDEIPESMKRKGSDTVIFFTNTRRPSFSFEILKELLSSDALSRTIDIIISLPEKSCSELEKAITEEGQEVRDNLIFIEQDDLGSTFLALSRADLIVRPLSCDGETLFERFTLSARKTFHDGDFLYFPDSLVFVKEGKTAELCSYLVNTMLTVKAGPLPEITAEDSYTKLIKIYQE